MKTACKRQDKAVMDISFVIRAILKAVFSIKTKRFSLKSGCECCMLRHLKEHSAVVVKKEF